MSDLPSHPSRRDNRLSAYLDQDGVMALERLKGRYPGCSVSDFVNASLKWLAKCDADSSLDGNLQPPLERFFPKKLKL